jgi:hypothetical protein
VTIEWTPERYRSLAAFMRRREARGDELERRRATIATCAIGVALEKRTAKEIKAYLAAKLAEIEMPDQELSAKLLREWAEAADYYERKAAELEGGPPAGVHP